MSTLVIKKYQNRKLYNPETKSYVTLKDIAVQIGLGREVQVVENSTGSDITGSTLLRAIVEYETDYSQQAPMFADIIKAGGLSKYVSGLTPKKDTV